MNLPSLRVLVVDDSRDTADTLAAALEALGQEVRVAYDGDTALEILRTFQPELAILDIGMPGLNGHELARRVRADPALPSICLVALSGWGLPADRKFALASGFHEHYAKPISIEELEKIVRRCAEGATAAQL